MTRTLSILALAALVALPGMSAEARPGRPAAKPQPNAAIEARRSKMKGFDARMSRLDSLMGASARASRARSADAEH